jgi:hypothetical protein
MTTRTSSEAGIGGDDEGNVKRFKHIEAVEWRTIKRIPDYEISNEADVRNKYTKKIVTYRSDSHTRFRVPSNGRRINCFVPQLFNEAFLFQFTKKFFPSLYNNTLEWRSMDIFLVSSCGIIVNIKKHTLVKQCMTHGYYCCRIAEKTMYVHRIVLSVFDPNPNANILTVNHKNGCTTDNRLINLEWADCKQQMRHASDAGLLKKATCDVHPQLLDPCDLPNEEWKQVYFEGLATKYVVSNLGRVKNQQTNSILRIAYRSRAIVNLYIFGKDHKLGVARLVAISFVPNHDNLPYVVHNDHDQKNNCASNLSWSISSSKKLPIPVIQMDINGNDIRVFSTIKEAADFVNVQVSSICDVCRGRQKTAKGFKWKYQTESEQ